MTRLRSRRAALVLGVVGAVLTLLTMSLTWGQVSATQASTSGAVLTGREAAPAAFALSLAALAGLAVLLLVGGTGRRVVGLLLVVLGVGTSVSAATAALDLRARTLAGVTGPTTVLPGTVTSAASLSPWWAWAAAVGGVLVVVAGVLALLGGSGWPEPSSRYGSAARDRPTDPWRALDEGVDPTLDA